MINVVLSVVFVLVPVLTWWTSRSLAWTTATFLASSAFFGALLQATIAWGLLWSWSSLQLLALTAFGAPLVAALVRRKRCQVVGKGTVRLQLVGVVLPVALAISFFLLSRLISAPTTGLFSGVGFLVQRIHAEDNAKWLDFTSQLAAGQSIEQAVVLGGPLQVFLIPVATVFAALSSVIYGGVNEVLVSVNTVIASEFLLAALAGLGLAPIVERRWFAAGKRRLLPVLTIWAGVLILIVGSLAASGLGHLTLQYAFLVMGLWAAALLSPSGNPGVRWWSSFAVTGIFLVWFPLVVFSGPVLFLGSLGLVIWWMRDRRTRYMGYLAAWLIMAIFTLPEFVATLRYMTDTASATADGGVGGAGAGISAVQPVPRLQLLSSQGGTEVVSPLLAVLAVVALIGAAAVVTTERRGRSQVLRFAPIAGMLGYGFLVATLGTWFAGSGPNYGALKITYLAVVITAAVCVPIALAALASSSGRLSLAQIAALGGTLLFLTVDGLLPRALTYASPTQWPEAGIWSPAEVRPIADQPIAALPIGCAYRIDPVGPPSVLMDGQRAYSCTRLLAGLAGADGPAQPLVDWQRREWLTNTPAWLDEYPNLINMPEWVRTRPLILLDEVNRITGLESVESFLQRYRPAWAESSS